MCNTHAACAGTLSSDLSGRRRDGMRIKQNHRGTFFIRKKCARRAFAGTRAAEIFDISAMQKVKNRRTRAHFFTAAHAIDKIARRHSAMPRICAWKKVWPAVSCLFCSFLHKETCLLRVLINFKLLCNSKSNETPNDNDFFLFEAEIN